MQCLVASDLCTSGVAETFIHASSVKRTRCAHSVSAAALFVCLKRAYNHFCEHSGTQEHACQSRDGDLNEFFRHENHPYPPALTNLGALRFGSKSDLLSCVCSDECR